MVKNSRKAVFSAIAGMIIGFCYVAGYSLDNFQSLDLVQGVFYVRWALCGAAAAIVIYGCFWLMGWIERQGGNYVFQGRWQWLHRLLGSPLCCGGLMLICWLPALLSLFPGAFAYDAYDEWQQVAQGQITAHHPVLHVLMLGGLVEGLHSLTGSYNTGMAVYSLIQMVLLSAALAYTIDFMQEFQISERLLLFTLLFYCLSPVVQLFAISATKDVLFSAVELLFLLCVIRFCSRPSPFFESGRNWFLFGFSTLLTMILRNNGLYIAAGVLLALLALCLWKRRDRLKQLLVMLAGVLVFYGVYVGPVYALLGVEAGGVEEMLSVPLQQMARVYHYDYEWLEPEELELLYSIVPKESLDAYRATVSDFVKKDFDRETFAEKRGEFIQLWVKWGKEHPLTYINSFLINTVDIWYPHAVVDGYQDAYGKSSYFDYQVDEPGTEVVLLPRVHEYYEAISHKREVQKIPLVFLVLSPGWYFMIWLVITAWLWCRRRYALGIPMLVFALTMATVLLGPVALVRYVLIFYLAFPVLLGVVIYGSHYV